MSLLQMRDKGNYSYLNRCQETLITGCVKLSETRARECQVSKLMQKSIDGRKAEKHLYKVINKEIAPVQKGLPIECSDEGNLFIYYHKKHRQFVNKKSPNPLDATSTTFSFVVEREGKDEIYASKTYFRDLSFDSAFSEANAIVSDLSKNKPATFELDGKSTRQSKPKDLESGKDMIKMLFTKGTSSFITHEAFGHSLEDDRSCSFKSKIGKKICSSNLSLTDNSASEGHFGSYEFDDLGNKKKRRPLVINGVLVDLIRAGALGDSNRKETCKSAPSPRMGVLELQYNKASSLADLRDEADIIVERIINAKIDKRDNKVSIRVVRSFLRSQSELVPLLPFTIEVNSAPLIDSILGCSDVCTETSTFCKGESGTIPVTEIQPDILVSISRNWINT